MLAMRPGCQTTSKREGRFNSHCRLSLPFSGRESAYLPNFPTTKAGFEALVGDYSGLPRCYLPGDYLRDANGFHVVKTVWAEFMSTDPSREVRWAENLSDEQAYPHGIIALVDFLSPDIERTLHFYGSLGRVRSVRQHLAWHPSNLLLRFATRSDVWADKAWQAGLACVRDHDLRCEIEIFSSQVPDLKVVANFLSRYPVHSSRNGLADRPIRCWPSGLQARYKSAR
jgi:predicted TIM-barrel fold metal-dependent hydrolase